MDDREELAALRRMAELEAKANGEAATLRAERGRPPQEQLPPNISQTFPAGNVALIGAGKTADAFAQGLKQLGLNASIAAKEATGFGNPRPEMDALNQQASEQQQNAAIYGALKKQFPLTASVGEALPLAATPMGPASFAARIGLPAAVYGATGALSYGSPQERTMRGLVQFGSGLIGGATGEAIGRAVMPMRDVLSTSAQTAARAAADKIGAPILPSQLANSPSLARFEDMLARYPGGAGVMGDVINAQKQAFNMKAQEAMGTTEPLTQAGLASINTEKGAAYDAMRAKIPGMAASSDVLDTIDKATAILSRGSTKGKEGALGMLQELKDKLYGTKQLTPEEYQTWVSDLAAEGRATGNDTIRAALGMVGKKMDQEARGPLSQEWARLDKEYAALKLMMRPGVTNDVTGDVNQGRFANAYERQFGKAAKTGKINGPMADMYAYARAVPQLREGSPTAERSAADSLFQWSLAPARYGAAKTLTSRPVQDYLSGGLLGSSEASAPVATLLQRAAIPLSIAPVDLGLLRLLYQ